LPAAAQNALKRAMSTEAADRFNSCADFAAALGGAKVGKAKKVSSGKSGGAWKWIAAVIVLALIAAGIFFVLNRNSASANNAADAEAHRIVAEQKAAEEKALAEKKAAEEKALAEKKAAEEKALAEKKAAEEKALAEKKAAEEKAREAERQKNLDKEHAALLSKLDQQKKKIQSNSWHTWEQNFNRQWEELQLQENTAKNSTRLDNKVEALEKAVVAADWIVTNAPKREDARKLIEAENAHKSAADQYEPMTFAKDLYTAAGANMTEGKAAYEKGDFGTALAKLQAGLDGYDKAKEAAYQGKLKFHLDEVEAAKKQGDWAKVKSIAMNSIHPLDAGKAQTLIEQAERELKGIALAAELKNARTALEEKRWDDVRTFARAAQRIAADDPDAADLLKKADEGEVAQLLAEAEAAKERKDWETALAKVNAVLEIESGNQAALALKNEAETHLVPTLKFQFTCNGEAFTMTPVVTALKTKPQANGMLERGKEYEFSFLCLEGNFVYHGRTSFTCDWLGSRQIEVALTKFDYVTEAERRGLKLSDDKKTVTGVKDKDITSCVI
ncbi:MAG: hypothetical protein IKK25_07495, partial [Lentisphaeria bacterium]|nr:hypothetical protein [Lentisphaeria bacterium]